MAFLIRAWGASWKNLTCHRDIPYRKTVAQYIRGIHKRAQMILGVAMSNGCLLYWRLGMVILAPKMVMKKISEAACTEQTTLQESIRIIGLRSGLFFQWLVEAVRFRSDTYVHVMCRKQPSILKLLIPPLRSMSVWIPFRWAVTSSGSPNWVCSNQLWAKHFTQVEELTYQYASKKEYCRYSFVRCSFSRIFEYFVQYFDSFILIV